MDWSNKIVGMENISPLAINVTGKNFREHGTVQERAMRSILEKVGWIDQVIVSKKTNNLIDGHLRVKIAIKNREEFIPVLFVDLTEEEENFVLATLDRLTYLAQGDEKKFEELMSVNFEDNDESVGNFLKSFAGKMGWSLESLEKPNATPREKFHHCAKCGKIWKVE